MAKRNIIGFKASIDENDKEEHETERQQITSDDLDNMVEERAQNQKEYENHMDHYNSLCRMSAKLTNIKHIITIVLSTCIVILGLYVFYNYAYKAGAKAQLSGNGPYILVKQNNTTYIIER